jgi:hypothetical protein
MSAAQARVKNMPKAKMPQNNPRSTRRQLLLWQHYKHRTSRSHVYDLVIHYQNYIFQKVHIVLPRAQNLVMELHTSKGLAALLDLNARMTVKEARSLVKKIT